MLQGAGVDAISDIVGATVGEESSPIIVKVVPREDQQGSARCGGSVLGRNIFEEEVAEMIGMLGKLGSDY